VAQGVSLASQSSLGILSDLKTQFNLGDEDIIEFTIENKSGTSHTFTYSGPALVSKTIQDVVNDINTKSNELKLGVKALYDATNSRFFLQTKATGAANGFKVIENVGGNVINFFTKTSGGSLGKLGLNLENNTVYSGTDTVLNFAGAEGIVSSSNNLTVNGINFTVKKTGTFTVEVSTDVEAVYGKIKAFVEKYNEMLEKVGSELGKKRNRDYLPLTKEQKEAMSEKEVELWEEKAKSGLLRGDMILERVVQTVRSGMYQEVTGVQGIYKQLTEIGITTQGYISGAVGGKLVIDESRLKEAIARDVDSVLEFLFKEPSAELRYKSESSMTGSEIAQKRSESGLIVRLYDNIVAGMKEIVGKAGTGNNSELYRKVSAGIMIDFVTKNSGISLLEKEEAQYTKKIEEMNSYLARLEDSYWKKFSAMEKALGRMNAQSTWLAQQFSQR
jgi:flagellar hook-associated protein 2